MVFEPRHQELGRRRLAGGLRVPEALMFVTVPFPVSGLFAVIVETRVLDRGLHWLDRKGEL